MKQAKALVLLLPFVVTGCAARKYRPEPITPAASAARLESLSLNDPGLQKFIQSNLGRTPPTVWGPAALTLAAIYYSPDLRIARATLKNAEAGIVTAGARPNPNVHVGPGYSSSPDSPLFFESAA
jgi:outer membrane protein, heavy metal efflux system